jgi:hypothetical protein
MIPDSLAWLSMPQSRVRHFSSSYAIVSNARDERAVAAILKGTAPQGPKPTSNLELLRHDYSRALTLRAILEEFFRNP